MPLLVNCESKKTVNRIHAGLHLQIYNSTDVIEEKLERFFRSSYHSKIRLFRFSRRILLWKFHGSCKLWIVHNTARFTCHLSCFNCTAILKFSNLLSATAQRVAFARFFLMSRNHLQHHVQVLSEMIRTENLSCGSWFIIIAESGSKIKNIRSFFLFYIRRLQQQFT